MTPLLKAVCMDCWEQGEGFYLDAEDAGTECPNDHDGVRRVLRKRRLYICDLPNHCDEMGYLTAADLVAHKQETY